MKRDFDSEKAKKNKNNYKRKSTWKETKDKAVEGKDQQSSKEETTNLEYSWLIEKLYFGLPTQN